MGAEQSYCTSISKNCGSIEVSVDARIHEIAAVKSVSSSLESSPRNIRGPLDLSDNGLPKAGAKLRGVLAGHSRHFAAGDRGHDNESESRRLHRRLVLGTRSGDFKRTVDAVSDGADIHFKDLRGQTALMLAAASYGKRVSTSCSRDSVDDLQKDPEALEEINDVVRIMKFLIGAKADVEARDDMGWSALLHACRNSHEQNVDFLLKSGASIKARGNDGKTALMLAAMEGADGLVHLLIEQKAQIDKKDEDGWSVLLYACKEGRKDLVKSLLEKGASAQEKAKDGTTAIMVAAEHGNLRVGKLLVKKGALCNLTNSQGNTALMLSLMDLQEDFAFFLINDCNVDVTVKNQEELAAVNIADRHGMISMKGQLEIKGRIQAEENQV